VEFITHSGPLTLAILALTPLMAIAVAAYVGSLGRRRWRGPVSASWLGWVGLAACGGLGTELGFWDLQAALGHASAVQVTGLRAAGSGVALYGAVVTLWCVAFVALVGAVVAAGSAFGAPGPHGRQDGLSVALAAGGGLAGALIAALIAAGLVPSIREVPGGVVVAGGIAAVAPLPAILAASRVSDADRDAARAVALRVFAAMSGALAVGCAAEATALGSVARGLVGFAASSPEVGQATIAGAVNHFSTVLPLGAAFALPSLGAAAGALPHTLRLDRWSVLDAGLGFGLAGVGIGASAWWAWRAWSALYATYWGVTGS
jgi:hypothetical protein